jgi:hypothetical protein
MVKLLLGLTQPPSPHDAADALAVAICHLHSMPPAFRDPGSGIGDRTAQSRVPGSGTRASHSGSPIANPGSRSWRQYRPRTTG